MSSKQPFTDIPHLTANWRSDRMANVIQKNSISAELAQKMVDGPLPRPTPLEFL